ncbi:MAG: anthranilate phosphoribosyltransferase [Hyphomicrobiaceae bacterium]|nr:anthranilate phosphoribosyltransferase [Hyphomicrobiaceae bacterium]
MFKSILGKIAGGGRLERDEARRAFDIVMSGEATPAQIGAFLMGLRLRGETIDEITGAVETMRSKMLRVTAPADAIDIVGTGGDGSGSYNVSTASAFVAAACGVPVAKHGNRALSSRSGAADTLMALGVKIDLDPLRIAECIREAGLGFMFAPAHHSAMKHVGPARVELGFRTLFNLLGPMSNPAGVRRQMTGAFSADWIEPMARVLGGLGTERAWVVNGCDGLDEITTTGPTRVAEWTGTDVRLFEITPEQVGLRRADPSELKGGDAGDNAAALRLILDGEHNAYRDIVLINTAAALVVADKAPTLADGVTIAADAIDSGAARACLAKLVEVSNR